MPSYAYNDGDGLSVIDKTVPNGAVETVAILDDALKQVKAYLKDATAGVAKIQADVTAGLADITAIEADITALEAADVVHDASIANLLARVVSLETQIASILGSAPVTLIATMSTPQAIAAGAGATIVQFNTESIDTLAAFNPSTYTFTAPTAGLYDVMVALELGISASSAPTVITHIVEVFVAGVSAAKRILTVGTDTTTRTIELFSKFQLSATQAVLVKYTATVGSGTLTTTIGITPTMSILQISRASA